MTRCHFIATTSSWQRTGWGRYLSLFVALAAYVFVCGCGRIYHLPGHNEDNINAPPDLTMRVGERREALSNGFNVKDMGPVELFTDNSSVVAVERPDRDDAYLHALAAGKARIHYIPMMPENKGFVVTVKP
jgi:hypothetical protein